MQVLKGILRDSLVYYERLERELKRRIQALPKGSVKRRSIRGHTYYYLQFRQGRRVVHRYLGRYEPEKLIRDIKKRHMLMKELVAVRQALRLLPKRKLTP